MYCMSLSCHSSIIWSVWLNRWVFVNELSGCGFEFRSNQTSDVAPASSKEYYDIHAKIQAVECGFTLKLVSDMKITYSQTHHTDKYSRHSSTIRLVWLNGWVFVYELSGCGFESRHCHLIKCSLRKKQYVA